MNREAIRDAIPHRDPFLFLDRVVDETETSLVAEWTVPADAPWFAGHYPGEPVMPGVLITEHALQAAAVLISLRLGGFDEKDGVPVLTKLSDARFRRVVRPGETLVTHVRVDERVGPAWYMRAQVSAGEDTVLKLGFVLSATDAIARVGS